MFLRVQLSPNYFEQSIVSMVPFTLHYLLMYSLRNSECTDTVHCRSSEFLTLSFKHFGISHFCFPEIAPSSFILSPNMYFQKHMVSVQQQWLRHTLWWGQIVQILFHESPYLYRLNHLRICIGILTLPKTHVPTCLAISIAFTQQISYHHYCSIWTPHLALFSFFPQTTLLVVLLTTLSDWVVVSNLWCGV